MVKYTYTELKEMTKKELRDYIINNSNMIPKTNLTKCELRIMILCKIGIKQNF